MAVKHEWPLKVSLARRSPLPIREAELEERYAGRRRVAAQSFSGPGSFSNPPLPADPNLGVVNHFAVVVCGGFGSE